MVENPAALPEAARVIDTALRAHDEQVRRGLYGPSASMMVYAALKAHDLLRDDAETRV